MLINTTSTVFLVDDDADIRSIIALYVTSAGATVQQYESAEDFLANYNPDQPGCLLLDIYMSGMTGLELQKKLNDQHVDIPIIIITAQGDVKTAVQAMKAGAIDYIEKPLDKDQMLERIHECLVLDSSRRDKNGRQTRYGDYITKLTSREFEIMELMVAGKMNKVIASALDISQRTVEDHRASIMKKMNARSLADVVRIYLLSKY